MEYSTVAILIIFEILRSEIKTSFGSVLVTYRLNFSKNA